jgi:ATP-dependent Clp protease protease subunit
VKRFWNWQKITNESGEESNRLYLNGPISEETWWGDEVTPAAFREELDAIEGDIEVWINSPGGDVFAASQIYDMLMAHKGHVKVMIDSIAASAASVIAMAGTDVFISPTGMIMIHNPATIAFGDHNEMQKAIDVLNEVKESIINAYQIKTGMSRQKLARLMEDETWMNARKAVELGFADKIAFTDDEKGAAPAPSDFSTKTYIASITNKLTEAYHTEPEADPDPAPDNTVEAKAYYDRLEEIKKNF